MDDRQGPRQFATTHWSLVRAARPGVAGETRAREALEALCRVYWYPLYAFVRSRGHAHVDAQDLTQEFFARIIEAGGFASADPEKGRFRAYLLGAMKHFLVNEWRRAKAQKRGGSVRFIPWDAWDLDARYAGASRLADDPERLFDREWAIQTVSEALKALEKAMTGSGKRRLFDVLKGCLTGESELTRQEMASELDMSEGAVKVAVHRMRRRFRKLLRKAIADTVANEEDLDDEMRHLLAVLREV